MELNNNAGTQHESEHCFYPRACNCLDCWTRALEEREAEHEAEDRADFEARLTEFDPSGVLRRSA